MDLGSYILQFLSSYKNIIIIIAGYIILVSTSTKVFEFSLSFVKDEKRKQTKLDLFSKKE